MPSAHSHLLPTAPPPPALEGPSNARDHTWEAPCRPGPSGAGDPDPDHSSSRSPRCPWDLRAMGVPGELWEQVTLRFKAPDHCCPEAPRSLPGGAGNARKQPQEGPGVPQAAGVERRLLTGPDRGDPWAPSGPGGPSQEDWLLQFRGWGPGEIPFPPHHAALARFPASISQACTCECPSQGVTGRSVACVPAVTQSHSPGPGTPPSPPQTQFKSRLLQGPCLLLRGPFLEARPTQQWPPRSQVSRQPR